MWQIEFPGIQCALTCAVRLAGWGLEFGPGCRPAWGSRLPALHGGDHPRHSPASGPSKQPCY